MSSVGLEERIRDRFEEVSHYRSWREEIPQDDFQLAALREFIGDAKGMRILDVGCCKGAFCRRLSYLGADVFGVDITESFVNSAMVNVPNGTFRVGSATDIPFGDNGFDVVYAFEVLEHVPDTARAIKEMVRVLRPNGKIMVVDKNIRGIHPQYMVPLAIYKRYMEIRDRWMYPRGFPFREKWFVPSRVKGLMQGLCSRVEVEYLPKGRKGRLSGILKHLPFLSMDVAWKGVK